MAKAEERETARAEILLRHALASPSYLNKNDLLFVYSKSIKPLEGYEDVVVYGDRFGFVFKDSNEKESTLSVAEFAELLRSTPTYRGGNIRLISCETGAEGAVAAQALADELGVAVIAPSDYVYVYSDGKMIVGPNRFTNSGKWVKFTPRR